MATLLILMLVFSVIVSSSQIVFAAEEKKTKSSQNPLIKSSNNKISTLGVSLTKTPSKSVVVPGTSVTYTYKITNTGTLPSEGSAQTLLQLVQMAAGDQELRQVLDYTRIVKAIARRSGEKNVEDFIRKQQPEVNPQVVSDQEAEQQVQAGNLVPLDEF